MDGCLAATLAQARDAYARRAWAQAFDLLSQADALAPLAVEDLERLLWCAGMLDRDADLFSACERLFHAHAQAGRHDAAAHWAFFHAFRLLALREQGRATAWMQRAQHHAERFGRECAACGYLLLPVVMRSLMAADHAAAADAAARAVAIGERCGDADLVAFGKGLQGGALARQGRLDEGLALLDEAMLAAVGGSLSPVITGLVYCNVIASCMQVWALDRAREWTQALSAWCREQPQLIQFNGLCQLHRAEIFGFTGDWDLSLAEARIASRSLARAIARETEAAAAYHEGEIHRLRGELAAAEASYRRASEMGFEPQPGMALLRLAQGQGPQAAATLRRVLAATGEPLRRVRHLPSMVEISLANGDAEAAAEAAGELERIAGRFASPVIVAIAEQACGELQLAQGDAMSALGRLRRALCTWQELDAPFIVARLRAGCGRACRLLGDEDGARLEFDAARQVFTRLGAGPELARLEAQADGEGRAPERHGLSRRELQVLALVAAGKTNKRIALDLGLSEKTVDRHLSNIFDKLQVSSRAGAAALALRRGLL